MEIEAIKFEKSKVLEQFLIDWGYELCKAVRVASSDPDLCALRSVAIEYSVMASTYSESTGSLREDLGTSLVEAVDFKIDMIKQHTNSHEWEHYLEDTEEGLKALRD